MSPGSKVYKMAAPSSALGGLRIVVADEDPRVVEFVITTLRSDGHAVFHAYDLLSATQLALAIEPCHLVISNTKVQGVDGVQLIHQLRVHRPRQPILYMANIGGSSPELEAQLPADVPILREPFTPDQLRAAVGALLNGQRA
jgi:DNA-binding response OmpR family regulator